MLTTLGKNSVSAPATQRCRAQSQRAVAATASKRVLVTGGNTGIGYQTALALLRKQYDVTIACRNAGKGAAAVESLRALVPSASVSCVPLDLADLSSVKALSSQLLDQGRPFDVLLNNAGVMATPRMLTSDGYEYQLGINHLGHFALTTQLLPLLQQNPGPVRIVNVSSTAHFGGSMKFDDLNSERSYTPWGAYSQSKLANLLFSYELARRLQLSNITVNALHPGVVATELGRYLLDPTAWYVPAIAFVAQLVLKTPEQGAATSIYLASSPEVEGVSGKYFDECKPTVSSPASYDVEAQARLWQLSEEMVAARSKVFA